MLHNTKALTLQRSLWLNLNRTYIITRSILPTVLQMCMLYRETLDATVPIFNIRNVQKKTCITGTRYTCDAIVAIFIF